MNKLNERRGIIIYLENVGKNIVRETGEQPKESYALIQGTDSKKTVRKDFSLQKNVFQTKLKRRNNIIFTDKRKFNIYDSDKSSRTWRSRRKKLTLNHFEPIRKTWRRIAWCRSTHFDFINIYE